MLLYDILRDICEEQREILENNFHGTVLPSVFARLPRLETVNITFCRTIEEEDWIGSVLAQGLTIGESHEFHTDAIRNAVQVAQKSRSIGSPIHIFETECD